MNIQTNFNEEMQEHLNALIGKGLSQVIFFRTNPVGVFTAHPAFANKNVNAFTGERLALIFRIPEDKLTVSLSFKSNNGSLDCHLIDNRFGGQIWNIDFHYERFYDENLEWKMPIITRIEEVELLELYSRGRRRRAISPFTTISFSKTPVKKIEVFGMKEYFEDITKVDFENLRYMHEGAFEQYSYPIDVNIVTYLVVSLSEDIFLHISIGGIGMGVSFCNEEQIQKRYELMKSRKNAFNRPFAKLLYTTES